MKPTAATALGFNQGDQNNRPSRFAEKIDIESTIGSLVLVPRRTLLLLVFGLMLSFVSAPAGLTALSPSGHAYGEGVFSGSSASVPSLDAPAVSIPVSLPNTTACQGSTNVMVAVIVGNTSAQNIIGYDFTFTFNTGVIQLANPAFETNSTLSQGWSITPNTSTPGQIRIVAFNSAPLSGSGPLIFIKFNVAGSQGATTPLTWNNFLFNEGNPGATTTNGSLTVTASGTSVQVSLPVTGASPAANNVMVPITVGDTTGRGIIGYDFTFIFDASVIQLANPAFETNGTLSQGWSVTPNPSTGQIRIVAFNSQPLSGSGALIFMKFNVIGAAGAMTQLTWTNFLFNEGNPCAELTNGKFTVTNPNAVKLERFAAGSYKKGVFLEWQTGFEVDNLGFNVYREQGGQRLPVNAQLIAGSALTIGSSLLSGQNYAWWDNEIADCGSKIADCRNAAYWLEDVDLKGESTWHGPFYPSTKGGAPPARSNAALLSEISNRASVASDSHSIEAMASVTPATKLQQTIQARLVSQPAVKLSIKREGWYRVSQSELASVGFDTRVDPRLLQLFVDGRELPILVRGEQDGFFDPDDSLEFHGVGLDSPFTDSRTYWLTTGTQAGSRIRVDKSIAAPAGVASFTQTVERRERSIYFSALRNGDRENFFGSVVAANAVDQQLNLTHVAQSDVETATLEVALQGVTFSPHRVSVELNGTPAGEISFSAQSQSVAAFSVPHSLLREGTNLVRLVAIGGPSDISLVDYVRIAYQHTLSADNDSLKLTAAGNHSLTIDGFASKSIRVFDVTDSSAPRELTGEVSQGESGYSVTFTSPKPGDRALLSVTAELSPAEVSLDQPSSLRSHPSDFIIITRQEFSESLNPLVVLRQSQGLSVSIVDIQDIYDEFSFGQKSPFAVRDYLQFAAANWKKPPRFVLFAGDASYDPKNYLGFGNGDLVSTKLVDTAYMETASDDWFADFNDDGVADLAIGRLPVRTPEEANLVVSKIIAYDRTPPSREVLLAADENDGYDFEASSGQLASLVPTSLTVAQINRGRVGVEAAKKNLLEGIYRGQKIVNYVGHGSVDQWRSGLLTSEDALALENQRLPVFVLMTCLNGFFNEPARDSLAESLIRAEHGGAAAVWASSGVTFPGQQSAMNQEFYRLVFSAKVGLTLGEAAARAKLAVSDTDVRRTWILMGDPTMKLK